MIVIINLGLTRFAYLFFSCRLCECNIFVLYLAASHKSFLFYIFWCLYQSNHGSIIYLFTVYLSFQLLKLVLSALPSFTSSSILTKRNRQNEKVFILITFVNWKHLLLHQSLWEKELDRIFKSPSARFIFSTETRLINYSKLHEVYISSNDDSILMSWYG